MRCRSACLILTTLILAGCTSGGASPPVPVTPPPSPAPPITPLPATLYVWPTQGGPTGIQPLKDACLNPTAWPTGWARMTALGNAEQWWGEWASTDPTGLAQCFANLRAAGKGIVVEGGALKPVGDCTTPELCETYAADYLAQITPLNPPPITFAIDEPLSGSEAYDTEAQAIAGTAAFIGLLRAAYPGLPMILEESYPHNSAAALEQFYVGVNAAAVGGVQVAATDHDWQASSETSDIAAIAASVRAAGMAYETIFWNASGVMDWPTGLTYMQALYSAGRVVPDAAAIQDWTGEPAVTIPESDPTTFTGSVLTAINQ